MSSTVYGFGWIAPLLNPVPDQAEQNNIGEELYDGKIPLAIGYSGELLIYDCNRFAPLGDREDIYQFTVGGRSVADGERGARSRRGKADTRSLEEVYAAALAKNPCYNVLAYNTAEVLPFSCIWYNGADSPVDKLTYEVFKKFLTKK